MDKDAIYKLHILDSITDIENYVKGLLQKEFEGNKIVQDAVMRKFQVIGEATKRLSPGFKSKHRDIPWKKVTGMRDILIHDYFQVDLTILWDTIQNELPALKQKLK